MNSLTGTTILHSEKEPELFLLVLYNIILRLSVPHIGASWEHLQTNQQQKQSYAQSLWRLKDPIWPCWSRSSHTKYVVDGGGPTPLFFRQSTVQVNSLAREDGITVRSWLIIFWTAFICCYLTNLQARQKLTRDWQGEFEFRSGWSSISSGIMALCKDNWNLPRKGWKGSLYKYLSLFKIRNVFLSVKSSL